jgi:hypothetical protein
MALQRKENQFWIKNKKFMGKVGLICEIRG